MNTLCHTYLQQLAAAHALSKPSVNANMSKEEIISTIHDCAEKLNQLHHDNDCLLNELLFSKSATTLTKKEADDLFELANMLFNYNKSPDVGIAYRIHKLLYEYALFHHDTPMMIKELYFQGITLMYLDTGDQAYGLTLFSEQIDACFQQGASYLKDFEKFDTSTRSYIIRSLGNLKHSVKINEYDRYCWDEYMTLFQKAMDVIESPYYRQLDKNMPWDTFAYTMHYDRTKFLGNLREHPDPVIAKAVLESANIVYDNQQHTNKMREKTAKPRIQYIHIASRYHAGLANETELMETLFSLFEEADLHDFSTDNIWTILTIPEYLIYYFGHLSEDEKQKFNLRLQNALKKQETYLFLLSWDEYGLQISKSLQTIVKFFSTQGEDYYHRILNYLLACHPPTFVHSKVVALLTRKIAEQLLKCNSDYFKTTHFSSDEKNEILDFAYYSGLYHDLGKCMLLNYVGLYSRNLLDEEFNCIKLHPIYGKKLLNAFQMDDYSEVAIYHHCAYDRKSGYPYGLEECKPEIRPFADIITVVDSLDAGTDNIGRSYASAKTYEQLVDELIKGKGSRYSPEVVQLFNDPHFYEEMKQYLIQIRYQTYIDAYCMNHS